MNDTEEQLNPCSYREDSPSYFSEERIIPNQTQRIPQNIIRQDSGLYEDILREIRNMSVLTPYQLHYLKPIFSTSKRIYIIKKFQ